jgi:hypothetical protein
MNTYEKYLDVKMDFVFKNIFGMHDITLMAFANVGMGPT